MPSLFTKGHQGSPKLQVFSISCLTVGIPLNTTKKIILGIFVWSIQKTTYLCTCKQKKIECLC